MDKNFAWVLILTAWAQAVPQFWLGPQTALTGFGIWNKRDLVRLLDTYFCWWDISSKRVVYGHTTLNTPDLVKVGQVWTQRPAQWLANLPLLKKKTPNQTHPQIKCDTLGYPECLISFKGDQESSRWISGFQKWTGLWLKFIQPNSTKMGSLQHLPVTSYKWSITFFLNWCLNTTWQVAQKPSCAFTLQKKKKYNTSSSLQIRQLKQQG